MAVTAFHYKKIIAEKNTAPVKKVSINNKVVLTDLKEAKMGIGGSKHKAIEVSFDHKTTYEPEVGSILLQGALLYVAPDAKIKETLDTWKKEKMPPPDVLQEIYNHILGKCSIEALIIGRDMLLPPHIPVPKMNANKKDKK